MVYTGWLPWRCITGLSPFASQQKQSLGGSGGGGGGVSVGGGGGGGGKGGESEQQAKRALSRQHAKDISDYTKQLLSKDRELEGLRKRLAKVRPTYTYMYMYTVHVHVCTVYVVLCTCRIRRPKASHLCMTCDTHTPGHPSAADEAWYWPKCVLCIG